MGPVGRQAAVRTRAEHHQIQIGLSAAIHHQYNGWVASASQPIESETDLPRLEEQIWELLAVNERTPAQEAYLTLLGGLVGR